MNEIDYFFIFLSRGSFCQSRFAIKDDNDNHVLSLRSPESACACRCEVKFTVRNTFVLDCL